MWKKAGIFLCILIVIAGLYIRHGYHTNYTWRYHDFLQVVTDVPHKEAIKKIVMHYTYHAPTSTYFCITVSKKKLTEVRALEMLHDITQKMEELMPSEEEQTLPFNDKSVYIEITAPNWANSIVSFYSMTVSGKKIYDRETEQAEDAKWVWTYRTTLRQRPSMRQPL